ncbi:MAG: flagellar biosynthetic protein FliO [bacterium]
MTTRDRFRPYRQRLASLASLALGLVLAADARAYDDSGSRAPTLAAELDTSAVSASRVDTEEPPAAPKPKTRKPSVATKRAADTAPVAEQPSATAATAAAAAPAPTSVARAAAPAPEATAAEPRAAIQPLTPIALPTPEPSALSTPVWPRPEAERNARRVDSSARGGDSTVSRTALGGGLGLGNPIDLGAALTRSAASVVVCVLVGGALLFWSKRRGHGALAAAGNDRDRLLVIASRALAPRRSLHLIEVEGVRLLIGVDAEQIRPLALVPATPHPATAAAVASTVAATETMRAAAAPKPAAAARPTAPEPSLETVDVRASLERATRSGAVRAPDPSALLGLASTLKRHLKNGNGSAA